MSSTATFYVLCHLLILSSSQSFSFWRIKLPQPMIYFAYETQGTNDIILYNGKSNNSTPIMSYYSIFWEDTDNIPSWSEAPIKDPPLNATSFYYMGQTVATGIDTYSPIAVSIHPQITSTNNNIQKNAQFQTLLYPYYGGYFPTNTYQYLTPYSSKNPCVVYNDVTNNIFIIGGESDHGSSLGHTVIYNTVENYFEVVGSLNINRSAAGCGQYLNDPGLTGDVFIFGGNSGANVTDTIERYSLSTKEWEIINATLPLMVSHFSCITYSYRNYRLANDTNIYCIGGMSIDGAVQDSVQIFNPYNYEFRMEKLNIARSDAVVSLLNDDCIIALGGYSESNELLDSVEVRGANDTVLDCPFANA